MGTGKTYSTKYLLDSNNNRGAEGQVLSTTSTGIDWVDANTVPGTGLWLESGNDIYNSNSANVGIGTTTPDSKLDINGVTLVRGGSFSTPNDARTDVGLVIAEEDFIYTLDGSSDYLRRLIGKASDVIQIGEPGTSLIDGINLKPGTTGGYVQIFNNASVAAKFVNDNLSLGMSDPQQKLHIVDTDGANIILNSNTGAENNGIFMTEGGIATPYVNGAYVYYDSTNNAFKINTGTSSLSTRFTIARDTGYVGVGSTSPSSKLELGPNGSLGADITNKNVILNVDGGYGTTGTPTSGQYKVIGFTGTTKDVTDITGQTSGEVLKNFYLGMIGGDYFNVNRFSFWQGGDERLTIQGYGTNAGNIGINSTNPTAKLHIAKTTTWGEMSNPIINIQNNGTGGDINTAHNMGSITWLSGTVSTAEIKAVRNTPASGDNVELRFSTSAAGVQGERMTINNNGIVFINNSLGVNVTSITTGYKLVVGGGDISANQAVAKISLGQIGSQGDAYFGASGLGSPTVGSQDYGFYSAHNAYRTATGAWKHSRADAIGAVRILGGGGGSSGNAGFSFDHSANNGTSDITWTNLMHLSTGGNLQLPQYGSGILVSDGNGTITSSNSPSISGDIVMGNNFVNYKFNALDNVSIQYWLLCFNAGANDVNGTLIGDRSSGHHQAMNLDIVISAKSASMQTGMLTTKQVLESNEKYTLVTLTYNSNNYIAIKYEGHPYPITTNGYFTGLLKSTIGSDFLLAVNGASVSAVAAFSNSNTKATIQAAKVGIGTDDPVNNLTVNGDIGYVGVIGQGNIYGNTGNSSYANMQLYNPATGYSTFNNQSYGYHFLTGGSRRMTILNGGYVGIGGSDPVCLLDVRDGTISGQIARFTAINPHVVIESSTAGNAVLHLKPNTTSSKSGQFKVTAGEGYNFRWSNDASGTGETAYMDLDTSTTGGGDLTVKGDVIAYGAPSDKKYKENIKPIESALDKAMQLQGVTFDWKDSESILEIKEDIGFIAQDVEKVLPELVRDNGKGNLSLRYQGITPILLEAIKELKAEIEELKKQIK